MICVHYVSWIFILGIFQETRCFLCHDFVPGWINHWCLFTMILLFLLILFAFYQIRFIFPLFSVYSFNFMSSPCLIFSVGYFFMLLILRVIALFLLYFTAAYPMAYATPQVQPVATDSDITNTTVSQNFSPWSFSPDDIAFCVILIVDMIWYYSLQIYVGSLDPNITEDELRQIFAQFGDLISVKIPQGKGCGFVQFGARYVHNVASLSSISWDSACRCTGEWQLFLSKSSRGYSLREKKIQFLWQWELA